jgi:hypothetical protein
VTYQVSADSGRTRPVNEHRVQRGAEFSAQHPLSGVWIRKNCVMVGDLASVPIVLAEGTLVLPLIISPHGPEGTYFHPAEAIPIRMRRCCAGAGATAVVPRVRVKLEATCGSTGNCRRWSKVNRRGRRARGMSRRWRRWPTGAG